MRRQSFALLFIFVLGLTSIGAAPGTVEVRLKEYTVEMPKTLPAGPTTFLIRNEGQKKHSFKIQGPGIEQILAKSVPPNETGTLQVTLEPGEYTVICPIGNHSAKGMTMTLVVTGK